MSRCGSYSVLCVFVIYSVFVINFVYSQSNLLAGDPCVLKATAQPGICTRVRECPLAIEELRKGKQPEICVYEGRSPIVCCPDGRDASKADIKCRDYANEVTNLNVFGVAGVKDGIIQEFPHMAALGFGDKNDIKWRCGGSLISEQFILTSANCLYTPELGPVHWVRLGDLDLDSGSESKRDYHITEIFYHPDFKPPEAYNDIGLVKIEQPVTFTPFIKPACLFHRNDVGQYIDLIATGWGLKQHTGDGVSILQKVYLDPFTKEECDATYTNPTNSRRLPQGIKHDQQFCAGGRGLDRDTCQGDSGGPLQTFRYSYGLYGIVGVSSFGKACGVANVPGVYIRVSKYVPWIESIVWP